MKIQVQVTRAGVRCNRCGFKWVPRNLGRLPKTCANGKCRSPYWNKLRVRK